MIPAEIPPLLLPAEDERIRRIVDPPAFCPGCLREQGKPWPDGATTRFCPRHAAIHFTSNERR